MNPEALITLATLITVLLLLLFSRLATDVIMTGAMTVLMLSGVLTAQQALMGFANPGLVTIAILYVVAAGLKETGAVHWLARNLLGFPKDQRMAIFRMILPTGLLSAYMNNTAVVAMFMPAIQNWSQRLGIAASKLLIPLSYISILGGTCTLIGTSTNLVVDGLLQEQLGVQLGLFEVAWVGIPLLVIGSVYLVLFAPRILPDNGRLSDTLDAVREYGVEVSVDESGPIAGKSIAEAGLRALSFGYLAEITRQDRLITVVEPNRTLYANDRLYFIGAPECAAELRRIQGLTPAHGNVHKMAINNHQRCLVEVVLGQEFPFIGSTVRESRFRTRYNAVILSVSRGGKRAPGKLGDITFQDGDTLLLEASQEFVEQYRFRRDFLLVSALNDSTPPNYSKAPVAIGLLLMMVAVSAGGLLTILEAGLLASGLMLLTGCLSVTKARLSLDLPVLIVVGTSFALGTALNVSGLAQNVAGGISVISSSPLMALILLYLGTMVFTEIITNNAAAALMFPIAVAVANTLGINPLPLVMAVMFAASASFITPLGYQTNLMVMGPGGYSSLDFMKTGIPLSLISAITTIAVIPLAWSF
jgi:di/tricarboxylate transporter